LNFRCMPEMVDWTVRMGATCIDLSPMLHWTPETREHLWIRGAELEDLATTVEAVVAMKKDGAPIATSDLRLRGIAAHFRGEKVLPELRTCRVGLRDYYILPNGDVRFCWNYPPIGNVRNQTARELWLGPRGQAIRRQTVACTVGCALSCVAHRPLKDEIGRGLLLIKRLGRDIAR
jgi:iron-sulfur cluster protein